MRECCGYCKWNQYDGFDDDFYCSNGNSEYYTVQMMKSQTAQGATISRTLLTAVGSVGRTEDGQDIPERS